VDLKWTLLGRLGGPQLRPEDLTLGGGKRGAAAPLGRQGRNEPNAKEKFEQQKNYWI